MTDVWSSVGVLVGIGLVSVTGWSILDPIIALLVAANIIWTETQLVRRSALGLMDTALPVDQLQQVRQVLDGYTNSGVAFHALRTRQSGARRFVSFHILIPNDWNIMQGQQLAERIEAGIRATLPNTTVFTHLEPQNDPASFADVTLDREDAPHV